jgi:hypothetical protein
MVSERWPVLSKPRARAWERIPTALSIGAGLWRSQMDALGRRAQARWQNPPPADHPAVTRPGWPAIEHRPGEATL